MKTSRQLREEAQNRAMNRASRSTKQQLALLDKRPGNAKRERARLKVA